MPKNHAIRRGALFTAAAFLGVSGAVVGFALPASAASPAATNSIVIGGGSNTTYIMMTQLGDIFNESPGCDLANPTSADQALNYSCPDPQNTTGGENGLGDGSGYNDGQSLAQGDPENPYNDVTVEEPPLGSSNGIKELEGRNAPAGTTDFPIQFARSSRGPNNGLAPPVGYGAGTPSKSDPEGLNFVAYAADAVPFLHWTKVNGKKTPSAKVTNLSVPQLQAIYNGTDTNWSQVGGTSGTIDVYTAQSGSGTESTFATETGLSASGPTLFPGVKDTAHVIFENEIAGIIKNGDEANAIFFFSYGKFQTDCDAAKGTCGSTKTPGKSAMALGNESITTGGSSITANPTTILNGTFPGDRYLYNVYSNGTNSTIPASSQATLNFVSEYGFICKQDSAVDSNSATGATYGTEITNVIKANGFFPLGSGTEDASNVDSNANITDPGYQFVDPQSTQGGKTSLTGNCRVFTTDGDGTS
jgi:ABC-type phosphate transport system substrate-binding protein